MLSTFTPMVAQSWLASSLTIAFTLPVPGFVDELLELPLHAISSSNNDNIAHSKKMVARLIVRCPLNSVRQFGVGPRKVKFL
jgi:hypothetical protein